MKNETLSLLDKIKTGDESAFDILAKEYEGLTEAAVKRFLPSFDIRNGENPVFGEEDLRQCAALALFKAAQTYDEGKEAHSPQERQRAKARYLASLQSKDVKKILKQHKVTQSHQKLMIDSYQERKLEQVPAFAWRTDKTLHFLVLEGHANEFEIPMDQIRGIYYEKNVTADIEKDYIPFQYSTYIAKMFQDLLPEYAERNVDGELVYQKNLFYLSNGLYITNTSMANLMKLLPKVPFLLDDSVSRSNRLDAYFKEIYKNRVLCEAHAITMDQYRQSIEDTLEDLIQAPISGQEFVKSLRDMTKYHLIDQQQVSRCSQRYRQIKNI